MKLERFDIEQHQCEEASRLNAAQSVQFLHQLRRSEMRVTRALLNAQPTRLILFTRAQCGLCETAKLTLSKVQQRRTLRYTEVDIMTPENKKWKDVYEFDVPVLHIQPATSDEESKLRKLFHRFSETEVEKVVDEVER